MRDGKAIKSGTICSQNPGEMDLVPRAKQFGNTRSQRGLEKIVIGLTELTTLSLAVTVP